MGVRGPLIWSAEDPARRSDELRNPMKELLTQFPII